MCPTPKLFISFSSRDQSKVRKLFAALEIQNLNVWDYSEEGQELPLGASVAASLKAKIDQCDYFLAIISPTSIDQRLAPTPRLEVRYAIDSGKLDQTRILPVLLDNPPDEWLELYPELRCIRWTSFRHEDGAEFENTIREICERLSARYTPSSLKNPRVFFAKLFVDEIEGKQLENSEFVKLMRVMDSSARKLLDENWVGVKEKTNLFLQLVDELMPHIRFHYPLVIRGVCELQLKQPQEAEQTFIKATKNQDINSNPLMGLGFAGLGHTYFLLGEFEKSLNAFEQALRLLPDNEDLQFNYLGALVNSSGIILDESVFDRLDMSSLTKEEQLKVLTLKCSIRCRNGKYHEAVRIFSSFDWNDLDEAAALYYSLALQACGYSGLGIEVLQYAANRMGTENLYHHLADAYLKDGYVNEAISVYENFLCRVSTPTDFARQLLVEYAQLIKQTGGSESRKFREVCERAVNFTQIAPPQSKADCFFTGYAFHLLGQKDLARHYFNNSADFSTHYYDELELKPHA